MIATHQPNHPEGVRGGQSAVLSRTSVSVSKAEVDVYHRAAT